MIKGDVVSKFQLYPSVEHVVLQPKQLITIDGPSRSGKSYFVKQLVENWKSQYPDQCNIMLFTTSWFENILTELVDKRFIFKECTDEFVDKLEALYELHEWQSDPQNTTKATAAAPAEELPWLLVCDFCQVNLYQEMKQAQAFRRCIEHKDKWNLAIVLVRHVDALQIVERKLEGTFAEQTEETQTTEILHLFQSFNESAQMQLFCPQYTSYGMYQRLCKRYKWTEHATQLKADDFAVAQSEQLVITQSKEKNK